MCRGSPEKKQNTEACAAPVRESELTRNRKHETSEAGQHMGLHRDLVVDRRTTPVSCCIAAVGVSAANMYSTDKQVPSEGW